MLTRYLAYICFATASCWTLFASWLLISTILEDPRHAWLSIGLTLMVLLPTSCTSLYVYRTGFGRHAGTEARVPRYFPSLSELEKKLRALEQVQQAFFKHIDLSQRLATREMSAVERCQNNHSLDPNDLPTAYPSVLDYRGRQWAQAHPSQHAADEIRVKLDNSGEWESSNWVSFQLLTIWEQEGLVCAVCNQLPKSSAAAGALVEKTAKGEATALCPGHACLLLLDPASDFRKGEDA